MGNFETVRIFKHTHAMSNCRLNEAISELKEQKTGQISVYHNIFVDIRNSL